MDKQITVGRFGATTALIRRYVADGRAVGIAAYVAKGGQTLHRQYEGFADAAAGRRIGDDTIYRIYSMSKVITSVAVLQLYEKGLFAMDDPVEAFLPAFKGQQVFAEVEPGRFEAVAAERAVSMRDLFTMTSGIPYPGADSPTARALGEKYQKLDHEPNGEEMMALIGSTPLNFQPGAQWQYGLSIDILGAALETITGKRLGDYLAENLTGPLGMKDTAFYLTEARRPRLAALYEERDGQLVESKPGGNILRDEPTKRPAFDSGGGGLYSTLDDYARFAQMLLNGGELDGARVLGRKTIDLMRTNHLTPAQRATDNWDTQRGYGYGLGVRVRMENEAAGSNGSVGEWGWDGMAGTWFCVDPAEDLIALFLVQRAPGDHARLIKPFMATFYGAL